MPNEIDDENFRPADLEAGRAWEHYPEFRPLWVEKCEAERTCSQRSGTAAFRGPGQGYPSEVPEVSPIEDATAWQRLHRARQEVKQWCDEKGLRDLSLEQ